MSIGSIEGFFLIESRAEETDAEFCAAMEGILQEIHVATRWWRPFKAGMRHICRGIAYREFECFAGSVSCQLLLRAGRDGGIQRAIVFREELDGVHRAYEVKRGITTELDPNEITAA